MNWAWRCQYIPGYGQITGGDYISECGRYLIMAETGGRYIPLVLPFVGAGGGLWITDKPCDTFQEAEAACLRHQSEREDD
jgi:hypothetical protein